MNRIINNLVIFLVFTSQLKSQTAGNTLFSMPQVHSVYMTFSQANYWDSLTAYYTIDKYLKGDIIIDGTTYTNVGIKFKGNSSYNNPSTKKSFKVDMNEYVAGQDVDGLKKFNLNNGFKDPSFLREKLALDFCNDHGIAAPRCAYSKVFINGAYWGLYTFVEEVDNGNYLKKHFGNDEGNMFKGDPNGDLKWINSTASAYYNKYELKTNETINDWSDLVNLIDNINNSGTYFYDSIEIAFNTNTFIKNWAVDNLFVNLDSYIGSGHNYFIYHDTLSNKFEWVTWDCNEAFGNFKMNMTVSQIKNLSLFYVSSTSNRPLVNKMLQNNTYKNNLATTVCQWIQHDFSNAGLDSKIDSLVNAIKADVYSDTKKTYTNKNFDDNIIMDITVPKGGGGTEDLFGIKPFITARRSALAAELVAFSCVVGVNETEGVDNTISIYPNPATDYLIIQNEKQKINSIVISDILGKIVLTKNINSNQSRIDISNLENGLYILNIDNKIYKRIEKIK